MLYEPGLRILYIQDSRFKIQDPNWCVVSVAYEPKSEEMGGLGEEVGDQR